MQTIDNHVFLPGVDSSWRIAIVNAPYYKEETDALVAEACRALGEAGIPEENITLHTVPGSFEIPLIGGELARSGTVDAMIGFGIIVQGETHHARLLAESVTQGMMDIQVEYGIPFAFEVLYVDRLEQARTRASGDHNKGREAAYAVLHSLISLQRIRESAY